MSKKINVIKVPNSKKEEKKAASFERMPRLYLELLENKDKIKPDMVNQEYDPTDAQSVAPSFFETNDSNNNNNNNEDNRKMTMTNIMEEENESVASSIILSETTEEDNKNEQINNNVNKNSLEKKQADEDDEDDDEVVVEDEDDEEEDDDDEEEEDDNDEEEDDDDDENKEEDANRRENNNNVALFGENETRKKLKELLMKPEEEFSFPKETTKSQQNWTKENEKKNQGNDNGPSSSIPKLSELEKRGEVKTNKYIPTLRDTTETDENMDELKRELLFKFKLLKKSYKNVEIPEFSMYSEYKNMNETYENLIRQVTLDSNVESYKSFLIGGFLLFEFILGVWLKFDMSGFTQQQILNMNQYERLLIELGEKSYIPGGSQWPVELRLLCMILINAVIFIVSKIILKKTGNNMVDMMNSYSNSTSFSPRQTETSIPKKKMRGPTMSFQDE